MKRVKVSELIEMLQKCPQDSIVMYDIENELMNEQVKIVFDDKYEGLYPEHHFSIDDALVCSGTMKGFVYLIADLLEE